MDNFNEINLGTSVVSNTMDQSSLATYAQVSELSAFSQAIDDLKTINMADTSFAAISTQLKRYYELLIKYLSPSGSLTSAEQTEFNSLTLTLSSYSLTSSDYLKMKSAILEIGNYLNTVFHNDLYGATGVYTSLNTSTTEFKNTLNAFIADIKSQYNLLTGGSIGKVFPTNSITEEYLDESLLANMKQIRMTNGIYVQKAGTQVPADVLALKPIILKVK